MSVAEVLGLRAEERRRGEDRRHTGHDERGLTDRRHANRRRHRLRSLIFGIFAVSISGAAHIVKSRVGVDTPEGFVSVMEEGYRALPATIAYNETINEAALMYNLDPDLIRAIIRAESAFNPFAVSRAGAQGLMQLMPAVAEELDVLDPFDPRQNIFGGARYLRQLLDRNKGNLDLAVASYNAGPNAVDRYNGIPPYRETRKYVKKVNSFLKSSRTRGD
jgi:Transglycosylase SLT domain